MGVDDGSRKFDESIDTNFFSNLIERIPYPIELPVNPNSRTDEQKSQDIERASVNGYLNVDQNPESQIPLISIKISKNIISQQFFSKVEIEETIKRLVTILIESTDPIITEFVKLIEDRKVKNLAFRGSKYKDSSKDDRFSNNIEEAIKYVQTYGVDHPPTASRFGVLNMSINSLEGLMYAIPNPMLEKEDPSEKVSDSLILIYEASPDSGSEEKGIYYSGNPLDKNNQYKVSVGGKRSLKDRLIFAVQIRWLD